MARQLFSAILIALAIAELSAAPDVELNASRKQKLVDAIGRCLERKAYAFDVDFEKWHSFAAARAAEMESARTKEEVAKILDEALEGFSISHLGVFAPSAVKQQRSGLRTGLGITVHPRAEGGAFISYVLASSPAQRCGLEKGDVLISIDGEPMLRTEQLAGEIGQKRDLSWKRKDEVLSCQIEYAPFSLSEPSAMTWIRDDVALIRIQSFQKGFYKAAKINRFFKEAKNAKAILIDLRNNRGGLSFYSRHLASKIAAPSETFAQRASGQTASANARRKPVHPLPFSKAYQGQVVVLVDALSASAADIVPAFVAESGRGIVIGQRTSGALLLARSFPLPYGFRIYLPVAELLTPQGKRLEGIGFAPTIELSLEQSSDDAFVYQKALDSIDSDYARSE